MRVPKTQNLSLGSAGTRERSDASTRAGEGQLRATQPVLVLLFLSRENVTRFKCSTDGDDEFLRYFLTSERQVNRVSTDAYTFCPAVITPYVECTVVIRSWSRCFYHKKLLTTTIGRQLNAVKTSCLQRIR